MRADELNEMLRRKQQLDRDLGTGDGNYTLRQRWLGEAVELLLKVALEAERLKPGTP